MFRKKSGRQSVIFFHRIFNLFKSYHGFFLAVVPLVFSEPLVAENKEPSRVSGSSSPVSLENLWIREPIPGQMNTAFYGTLRNLTSKPLTISKISFSGVAETELHESLTDGKGVTMMKPLSRPVIAPSGVLVFEPGGKHGMLMGLSNSIRKGDILKGKILLEGGQVVEIEAPLRP